MLHGKAMPACLGWPAVIAIPVIPYFSAYEPAASCISLQRSCFFLPITHYACLLAGWGSLPCIVY
jgi:hypothetical protein